MPIESSLYWPIIEARDSEGVVAPRAPPSPRGELGAPSPSTFTAQFRTILYFFSNFSVTFRLISPEALLIFFLSKKARLKSILGY